MLDKIRQTIEEYELIEEGDRVIVAISGGPDSVCLLHGLHKLKEEYGIELYGAHLNHNFRGIEAQVDAQYVSNLCESLNIMCFIKSVDVPKYAKNNGLSLEEAGRIVRYSFFEEIAERVGGSKIAVGQNENDQAETVLMRLMRGTGLQGLTAIHIKRDKIIRPLLKVNRDYIERYCEENNLEPRIDKTNLESIYHRNKIRLELIPYLEDNYNPNIMESLVKTADILKEDFDFVELKAREVFKELVNKATSTRLELPLKGIKGLHSALKSRVIRLSAEELLGRQEVLGYNHVANVLELVERESTGKRITLPMGLVAGISYENLFFTTDIKEDAKFYYELELEETTYIEETMGTFTTEIVNRNEVKQISRDKHIKTFDYDKIMNTLNVRNRQDGDRFHPLGLKGSKKLKDFFIDYKIDRNERDRIPLVCDGDEIIWIVGFRISEKYKITDGTKRILNITYSKKE